MLPFVHGGRQNACDGIRAEAERKYAEQLSEATDKKRRALLKKIKAKVRAMIKHKAPPEALY